MILNGIELMVMVAGRPIAEYLHNGSIFVEGRDGSEYEIEVRNNTGQRVEAVVSVDGLSVLDGKTAGTNSQGYLVEARGSVRIPGWRLNGNEAARFAFSGRKGGSYSAQTTGSAANDGVIGVMTFAERIKPMVYRGMLTKGFGAQPRASGLAGWNDPIIGSARGMSSQVRGAAAALSTGMLSSNMATTTFSAAAGSVESLDAVEQRLGTAFGRAEEFRTTTVQFERGDMAAMMVLYYDDARGLRARGIEVGRPTRHRYSHRPEAFPADAGCVPPPGWRG